MTSVINSMKAAKRQMDDKNIALELLSAVKGAASVYFMATLESPTPELRSMLKSALSQAMDGYSGLLDLVLNRGWINPYDIPEKQLSDTYRASREVVSYHKE